MWGEKLGVRGHTQRDTVFTLQSRIEGQLHASVKVNLGCDQRQQAALVFWCGHAYFKHETNNCGFSDGNGMSEAKWRPEDRELWDL